MKLKKSKYVYAKGFIFTMEIIISFILIFYLSSIINAANPNREEFYKLIFLNDVYEILEENHPDISFFAKAGIVNNNLRNLIKEIKIVSNKSFSIENDKGIKTEKCNGIYSIERAVMTVDGPKKIKLIYCD